MYDPGPLHLLFFLSGAPGGSNLTDMSAIQEPTIIIIIIIIIIENGTD